MINPLVSVLVPIYNVEKYLGECIDSVLSQTYNNWELILVDDGSKDSSGIIADQYQKKDKRIHVFHKPNEGLLHTRQFAIPLAQGDYCIFLDSDDYLDKNALETLARYIEIKDYDCLVYGYRRVKNDGTILSVATENEEYEEIKKESNIVKLLCNSALNSLCRKAIRTNLLKSIDNDYLVAITQAEDLLQSIDIVMACSSIIYLNVVLYNYRINEFSVQHTKDILKKQDDVVYARTYILAKIRNGCHLSINEMSKIRKAYVRIYIHIMKALAESRPYLEFCSCANRYVDGEFYKFICDDKNGMELKGKDKTLWKMIYKRQYLVFWVITLLSKARKTK